MVLDVLSERESQLKLTVLFGKIPLGISIGLSTRVANLMGEGKVALAKKLTRACCAVTYCIIITYVTLIYFLRGPIVGIFTSDPEVTALTQRFWGYLSVFIFLDSSW
jgi:Na+-driven multidrug efflux pump